jgi:hypothetical protein
MTFPKPCLAVSPRVRRFNHEFRRVVALVQGGTGTADSTACDVNRTMKSPNPERFNPAAGFTRMPSRGGVCASKTRAYHEIWLDEELTWGELSLN